MTNKFNPLTGLPTDNVTSSVITSTLTSLCSTSSKCDDAMIRSYLGQFYSACQAELNSENAEYTERIREMYDYLYIVNPFRSAVCSRNGDSQKYCVLEIASLAASVEDNNATAIINTNSTVNATAVNSVKFNSLASLASGSFFAPVLQAAENLVINNPISSLSKRFLAARGEEDDQEGDNAETEDEQIDGPSTTETTFMTPNATTYRETSLPYLFLQSNMPSKSLCTSCTRSVMAAYIAWEAQVPYAIGLESSPILGGQPALWSGIHSTCGQTFTDAIAEQAGVLSSNSSTIGLGGGASKVSGGAGQGIAFAVALAAVSAALF